MEVLEEPLQQLIGFFPIQIEKCDFQVFKVSPAFDTLVVKVVVNAAVGLERSSLDCSHECESFEKLKKLKSQVLVILLVNTRG